MASSGFKSHVQKALRGFLLSNRGEKRPAEDEYEDDDFVVKPKRIHLQPVNGQIGPCAGHEYEEEDVSDASDEEVLPDPTDLFDSETESEPETENDCSMIDKPHKNFYYGDSEAEESDGEYDNEFEMDGGQESPVELESDEEESDAERDKSIRSPLRQANYVDEEAEEHNNISEMYGAIVGKEPLSDFTTDFSGNESDFINETISIQTDDDEEEVYFKNHRRNNFLTDSDDSLSESEAGTHGNDSEVTGSQISVTGCPTGLCSNSESPHHQVSGTNGHPGVVDDSQNEDYTPDTGSTQRSRRNRKRYLQLRQLVKPWIVTSL